jgi:hypothetical protein
MKLVFKYRKERARTRVVYRPVAKLSLKSADGYWHTFTAYVDSGADVSLFARGAPRHQHLRGRALGANRDRRRGHPSLPARNAG